MSELSTYPFRWRSEISPFKLSSALSLSNLSCSIFSSSSSFSSSNLAASLRLLSLSLSASCKLSWKDWLLAEPLLELYVMSSLPLLGLSTDIPPPPPPESVNNTGISYQLTYTRARIRYSISKINYMKRKNVQ